MANTEMEGFEEQKYTPKYDATIWNTKTNRAKPGDTITGKVLDINEDTLHGPDGKDKKAMAWTIELVNGDKMKTPAHAQLIGKLDNAEVGDIVKIEHLGLVEFPGGKTGRGYNVWIKKAKK